MSNPKYTPGAIVNFFLKLAEEKKRPLSHLQLQKLLYFAHAWHMAFDRGPLINEQFEAWEYGPVCSSVYHEYKNFGPRFIPSSKLMSEFDFVTCSLDFKNVDEDDHDTISFLNEVWNAYASYDGVTLSHMTHHENPDVRLKNPWKETINAAKSEGLKGGDIDNGDIEKYFKELKNLKRKF